MIDVSELSVDGSKHQSPLSLDLSHAEEQTGAPEHLDRGVDLAALPAVLRTLMASDGTVTRFLEAYYGEPIQIEKLFHGETVLEEDLPDLELTQGESMLRRSVVMRGASSRRIFGHALSYVRPSVLWPGAADDLIQGWLGIGELLQRHRIETFRELLRYQSGPAADLAAALGTAADEPVIQRTYRIHIGRKPSLLITDSYAISYFV